jgi:hypothetical protein
MSNQLNKSDNRPVAPKILIDLYEYLYDADLFGRAAAHEDLSRVKFARDVTIALEESHNFDRIHDLFIIARLDTGEYSALKTLRSLDADCKVQITAINRVVSILKRRLEGADVENLLIAARDAADKVARASRDSAVCACVDAAATLAHYLSFPRYCASAVAFAASGAASDADLYTHVHSAARADLIAAIYES